jgi:hypothetical protein
VKLAAFFAIWLCGWLGCGIAAAAEDPMPYRLWWSFPRDDLSAIEIDDPDLHVSEFSSKWNFVSKVGTCDRKVAHRAMKKRAAGDGTPLRELRIETLDSEGKVHDTVRCVMPLASWRTRIGQTLTERLEDELDAHMSFLVPRKYPHKPPTVPAGESGPPPPTSPTP